MLAPICSCKTTQLFWSPLSLPIQGRPVSSLEHPLSWESPELAALLTLTGVSKELLVQGHHKGGPGLGGHLGQLCRLEEPEG